MRSGWRHGRRYQPRRGRGVILHHGRYAWRGHMLLLRRHGSPGGERGSGGMTGRRWRVGYGRSSSDHAWMMVSIDSNGEGMLMLMLLMLWSAECTRVRESRGQTRHVKGLRLRDRNAIRGSAEIIDAADRRWQPCRNGASGRHALHELTGQFGRQRRHGRGRRSKLQRWMSLIRGRMGLMRRRVRRGHHGLRWNAQRR